MLNYLTTPNVVVWSAAAASSAIPYIFAPTEIMIKTDSGEIVPYNPTNSPIPTLWIDGSVGGDLPM